MSAFPPALPRPEVGGYQLAPLPQAIRTDMEVGAPRVRRRTAARLDRVSVRWVFTDEEMQIFRAWINDPLEAAAGAAWIEIDLPIGLAGIATYEARVAEWSAQLLRGLRWDVSAMLEVRGGTLPIAGAATASATASGTI